ncbi:MAG: NUDIX domain-containing protein [Gemmatimonadaceae bacterium]|nr:NUDIX domain-containing protein [Gemmatimonadaceae bacterium]
MTDIRVGVVDVVITRGVGAAREVLALQRGPNGRNPGSWEIVHGSIEADEAPEAAALREVAEESGLIPARLYSLTVHPFYLPRARTVQLAVVFAAVIEGEADVRVGPEHDAFAWWSIAEARAQLSWPREAESLTHLERLLGGPDGTAGVLEDVLRVR